MLALYSIGWEYSTRRYLKGFSDAIVSANSSPLEKIQTILDWMAHGPARETAGPEGLVPDRDPTQTLNYKALLQVCGTATNAFLNLGESGGLAVRRLLLLDSRHLAKHVVAEVLVDGRWIVVDPAFRVILRGPNHQPLTRVDLTNPETFAAATRNIPRYDPSLSYERTAHIRLGRLRFVGLPLRSILDRFVPGWEDSITLSLLAERESLAAIFVTIFMVAILLLLRVSLRWYGENRLGVRSIHLREQFRRAFHAFLDTVS